MKKVLALIIVNLGLGARLTHAQGAAPPKPDFATEIASSDSLYLGDMVISPDGRWILFTSAIRKGPSHLWAMPASGGAPRKLTEGSHDEVSPAWFPSGRRIAFTSSNMRSVMTADFDPVTGRLVGAPKRASLEEGSWVDVSPDGKRIVYLDQRQRLRLIPANGGPATTILDQSGAGRPGLGFARFSRDGRDVYVTAVDKDGKQPNTLLRVPVNGGPATVALVGPVDGRTWSLVAEPARDRVLVYTRQKTIILTLRGDTIAVMPPFQAPLWVNHTPDGRQLLKATAVVNAVVRLVPTAGGKLVDATTGTGYAYPLSWSPDGKELYSTVGDSALTGGKAGLLVTTVDGGARRFIPLAPSDSTFASRTWRVLLVFGGGRYWALTERQPKPPAPLMIYDVQTRQMREVTRNAMRLAYGPGGYRAASAELFFIEQRGTSYELRAVRGDGAPRIVHAFSRLDAPWHVAVHGARIAFGERVGDSTAVYVTRAQGTERRLTALAGDITELVWSPDGRTLATVVSPSRANDSGHYNVAFIDATEEGTAGLPPRVVRTEGAWDLAWLADGRAVTVLEEQGATMHTRVLRVPLDANQQPTSLTPNEKGTFWDQYTSPDGRYSAIPVEQPGRSTLWSIDVEAAARAYREKRPPK